MLKTIKTNWFQECHAFKIVKCQIGYRYIQFLCIAMCINWVRVVASVLLSCQSVTLCVKLSFAFMDDYPVSCIHCHICVLFVSKLYVKCKVLLIIIVLHFFFFYLSERETKELNKFAGYFTMKQSKNTVNHFLNHC